MRFVMINQSKYYSFYDNRHESRDHKNSKLTDALVGDDRGCKIMTVNIKMNR